MVRKKTRETKRGKKENIMWRKQKINEYAGF